MTQRIILSPKASQDLDDHFAYIAQNNSEAALQFFDSAISFRCHSPQVSLNNRFFPEEQFSESYLDLSRAQISTQY